MFSRTVHKVSTQNLSFQGTSWLSQAFISSSHKSSAARAFFGSRFHDDSWWHWANKFQGSRVLLLQSQPLSPWGNWETACSSEPSRSKPRLFKSMEFVWVIFGFSGHRREKDDQTQRWTQEIHRNSIVKSKWLLKWLGNQHAEKTKRYRFNNSNYKGKDIIRNWIFESEFMKPTDMLLHMFTIFYPSYSFMLQYTKRHTQSTSHL